MRGSVLIVDDDAGYRRVAVELRRARLKPISFLLAAAAQPTGDVALLWRPAERLGL
jgi:hypothetical protein